MKVKSESEIAQSCPTPSDPMDSLGFSRQEYWSGLPLPSPMTKLDIILKSKGIILLTKAHIVKAMVFQVVKYRCKSWTTEELMLLYCGVEEDS